ncbi:MAG TPA: SRPBCC family protein [Burkholderiales bacterium]|nr:SRPBCC family protein [Burkholderiales bacterium]
MNANVLPQAEHELVLSRLINATPEQLFRCWTDPALMKQWFVPKPWTIAQVETDVRPGGSSFVVMRSPEGQEFPNRGVYLEVVKDRKLVFTDAYNYAWVPSQKPFFTAIVTFDPEGDQTRYTARALHWNAEDRETHEKMGFHEGWGKCADQLAELAKRI